MNSYFLPRYIENALILPNKAHHFRILFSLPKSCRVAELWFQEVYVCNLQVSGQCTRHRSDLNVKFCNQVPRGKLSIMSCGSLMTLWLSSDSIRGAETKLILDYGYTAAWYIVLMHGRFRFWPRCHQVCMARCLQTWVRLATRQPPQQVSYPVNTASKFS